MAWSISTKDKRVGDVLYRRWSGIADASALSTTVAVDADGFTLDSGATSATLTILGGRITAGGVHAELWWDGGTDILIVGCAPGESKLILPQNVPTDVVKGVQTMAGAGGSGGTGDILVKTAIAAVRDGVTIELIIGLA